MTKPGSSMPHFLTARPATADVIAGRSALAGPPALLGLGAFLGAKAGQLAGERASADDARGFRTVGLGSGALRLLRGWQCRGQWLHVSVPRLRRRSHISWANSDRRSGGVARIIATAAAVLISADSPFIALTAVSHCARFLAPCALGLNCRVLRPSPARAICTPARVLQDRHAHIRFPAWMFSSWPST